MTNKRNAELWKYRKDTGIGRSGCWRHGGRLFHQQQPIQWIRKGWPEVVHSLSFAAIWGTGCTAACLSYTFKPQIYKLAYNHTPNRSAIRYGILYVCIRGRIVVIIKHMFTYINIFMYTRLKEKHFEIDLLCSCMHETIYRPLMILYRKRSTIEVMNMLEGLHTMHS